MQGGGSQHSGSGESGFLHEISNFVSGVTGTIGNVSNLKTLVSGILDTVQCASPHGSR